MSNETELLLHQYPTSGNCYKVRLTAAFLGKKIPIVDWNLLKGEHRKSEDFMTNINPVGKLPVLQIGKDRYLPESNAISYYLATGTALVPQDKLEQADMLRWMCFEQVVLVPNVAGLRFQRRIIGEANLNEEQRAGIPAKEKGAADALDIMDAHLSKRQWLVTENMTLADIVVYIYTSLAGEGGIDISRWPNVKAWCERVSKQPGYVSIE